VAFFCTFDFENIKTHYVMHHFLLVQSIDIDEKLKNAPDAGYQIGVVIGWLLPFILFVGIAYYMYYRAKNKKDFD
jgi:hypothetical protein